MGNGTLAIGIVAAALIVVLIRPPNIILNQTQSQSQSQSVPTSGGSSGNPFGTILSFMGL